MLRVQQERQASCSGVVEWAPLFHFVQRVHTLIKEDVHKSAFAKSRVNLPETIPMFGLRWCPAPREMEYHHLQRIYHIFARYSSGFPS